jgi:hypothetical protein
MGDIGRKRRRIEVVPSQPAEPTTEPMTAPQQAPEPTPQREPGQVPAPSTP